MAPVPFRFFLLFAWLINCFGQIEVERCKPVDHVDDLDKIEKLSGHWFLYASSPSSLSTLSCIQTIKSQQDEPHLWFFSKAIDKDTGNITSFSEDYTIYNAGSYGKTDKGEDWYVVDADPDGYDFEYRCKKTQSGYYEIYEIYTRKQFPAESVLKSLEKIMNDLEVSWDIIQKKNQTGCPVFDDNAS